MIDVDVVEADGRLAQQDLALAGLADLDLFPFEDLSGPPVSWKRMAWLRMAILSG